MKPGAVTIDADRALGDLRDRARRALVDAGEYLLEEANRTAPIEEGTLIGSGQVIEASGDTLAVFVSYDTPYAVRQHEDTRLRHDPGRRAKWLQHTFREQQNRITTFLANRIGKG